MPRPTRRAAVAGVLFILAAAGVTLMAAPPPPRADQWKKVEAAVAKGLPQTAIQELEPIIEAALKDKAYPEAIKAIGKKIALEGNIQGNKPEEKVVRMRAAVATAPAEMRPVMHAILAHWYWHYFQQNRWRIAQRTSAGEAAGDDLTTWDLPRILAEVSRQFDLALAAEQELKATPVAAYDILLEEGTIPDSYRPTLYDILAFDALGFYAAGEQAGAKAQDAWEVPADSPVFGTADEFLAWQPETTDADSRTLKAVRLYQKLLAFHQGDKNPDAFLDADLHRLRFGFNKAVGDGKDDRYAAALKRFAEQNGDHPLMALARYQWAGVVREDGDLVKAREIALAGRRAHPDSPGGKLCFNLVAEIEAKSSNVTTERVWADPLPAIKVTYRNVSEVHLRVVKADYVELLKTTPWGPESLQGDELRRFLGRKPEREFAHDLPPTPDYKERVEAIPAPQGLAPGFYYLFASHDPNFGPGDNVVTSAAVWVTDLAIVARTEYGTLRVDGLVLDARAGTPVAGATAQAWFRNGNNGYAPGDVTTTDKNGLYTLPGRPNLPYLVLVTHNGRQLATGYGQNHPADRRVRPAEQTIFFTDRSLYRPGQTVQFKGVSVRIDPEGNSYTPVAGRPVTVQLNDPNGKEVARVESRTNDYGSFSGSFTAPRDRLTGRMTINVVNGPPGGTQVSVEEYKRPKFTVTVEAPKDPARLGAAILVPGKATSYTGVPIGGAKVTYRVVREVRWPPWFWEYCWWRPMPSRPAQEIAHGTATTDPDGSFSVAFVAKPDPTVPAGDDPSFRYTVTADVTDTTGETRTGTRSVEVGYTALRAKVELNDWQTAGEPVKFTISTTTLDGEPQQAKGTLKVYALKQPDKVVRPDLDGGPRLPRPLPAGAKPAPDPSKPVSWEQTEVVHAAEFATDANGKAEVSAKLPAGIYRAVVETKDRFDKPVTAKAQVQVLDPAAAKLNIKVPDVVASPDWSVEPGQEFTLLWGTGYDAGRAYVEVEHRRKVLQAFWTDPGKTQHVLRVPVTEAMRGGFTVRVTHVQENRAYLTSRHVDVPWTNKHLTVKWEVFRSKLEPGAKETFTAVVTGPDANRAVAEVVAALYDQSLDAYLPHDWPHRFGFFRQDFSALNLQFGNQARPFGYVFGQWPQQNKPVDLRYRGLSAELTENYSGYQYFEVETGGNWSPDLDVRRFARGGRMMMGGVGAMPPGAPMAAEAMMADGAGLGNPFFGGPAKDAKADALPPPGGPGRPPVPTPGPDLSAVAARANLNETAFFFPHLTSDAEGVVRMTFTMPEALTRWKFLGFAHDKELRSGFLGGEVVTAKDLMAQPNPPRFLREGDVIEFPVKVSNRSATRQVGKARLSLRDARTDAAVDAQWGLANADQEFDLPAGESKTLAWRITVPDGAGPVIFKAVAATDRLSDGEEGAIPVLSKRVLVTESLPLPIRGPGTKQFEFTKLKQSGGSETIRSQSYTIQMVSQPAWYAVMALPYLMEYPYECSEQTFNRLYANALARHIANSDPKIRRVFDLWKNTPALDSPLEKNQDLKSVMLEETPWLRQAVKEGQARKNVGILFDANRLDEETARLTQKLAELQQADGLWPWFPGGPPNEYISLYIATGYGRLRHLGVKVDPAPAVKAWAGLDAWADRMYRNVLRHAKNKDDNHLSPTAALYLYGRSFFLQDRPVANEHKEAVDYWLGQAKKHWLQLAHRQSQAHLALALKRFGDAETARGIMASIKERSVSNEEMGMFWRDLELQYFWFRAPIETQAMMVEAFDEVMNDARAVEDCKVWLLKQKQTQDWKTTKATADAVYALLLRGDNLLKSDALVEVQVGQQKIVPEKVEAGTGFFEHRFLRNEVVPSLADITVTKPDAGVSWGGAHWQYLEDIDKVTPHEGTPLKLEKRLFKRRLTKAGPVLDPFGKDPLGVGDEVVVRVVLRTDRDMEYVHLKDHRGSGTEPVNVLSRYKFQDGLAYYESTKDTATHFFIDYLPKGNYVFEYPVRVQLRGKYPTGLASIECLYAPEFNSHSESIPLEVK
jgi:uncharacterized protein YfaS (alpha-2-macroglobulin family)